MSEYKNKNVIVEHKGFDICNRKDRYIYIER